MLGLPRLQGLRVTLKKRDDKIPKLKVVLGFCQQSEAADTWRLLLIFLFVSFLDASQIVDSFAIVFKILHEISDTINAVPA